MRTPTLYGISEDAVDDDKLLEQHRVDLIHSALSILDRCNCVKYDKRTGAVQVTDTTDTATTNLSTRVLLLLFLHVCQRNRDPRNYQRGVTPGRTSTQVRPSAASCVGHGLGPRCVVLLHPPPVHRRVQRAHEAHDERYRAPAPLRALQRVQVTESARSCSYILSKQVQETCQFWLLTFWLLTFWLLTFWLLIVPSALRL